MGINALNIVFFHPDLGIGGAERLVVDAAVGLQNRGHKVTIFTSHCDPTHCFDEARDGTLDVRVRGNSFVPPSFLGRFSILCAILRQIHLILQIALFSNELKQLNPHLFFVDQLSAGIPLLRLVASDVRILFYCHFPDKLLARKGSLLKSLYRIPFDTLESWSTGCSDSIVVNSKFTRGVFAEAFPSLMHRDPRVVYPCVDTNTSISRKDPTFEQYWKGEDVLLSINRFERKKDIALAIKAFAGLSDLDRSKARLVLAGGYDTRVSENVEYHRELCEIADSFGLKYATFKTIVSALAMSRDVKIIFLLSVPNLVKSNLLLSAKLLIYTPRYEHLGIVPLEAMLAGVPVLAANEGGPTETVVEGETGWLRDVKDIDAWRDVMHDILSSKVDQIAWSVMGNNGRQRVKTVFSKENMTATLEKEIEIIKSAARPQVVPRSLILTTIFLVAGLVTSVLYAR